MSVLSVVSVCALHLEFCCISRYILVQILGMQNNTFAPLIELLGV